MRGPSCSAAFARHLVRVHLGRPSVAHEELAVDEHMTHGARAATEEDPRHGVAAGAFQLLEVEHDEVGALALLEGADLCVDFSIFAPSRVASPIAS